MINKAEANAPDVVSMDVPFLTRVMEKCREDIKTDVDLHLLLEKIIAKAGTGTLTMKDYAQIEPADSQPEKEHAAKSQCLNLILSGRMNVLRDVSALLLR